MSGSLPDRSPTTKTRSIQWTHALWKTAEKRGDGIADDGNRGGLCGPTKRAEAGIEIPCEADRQDLEARADADDANEAEVTAQLAAHRTPPPPGPPWRMAGPTGTLVVIDTESELKTFVETLAGDPDVNLLNFRSMLGILQREAPPCAEACV